MFIYDAVNIYYVDLKFQYYTKYKQYNTAEYKKQQLLFILENESCKDLGKLSRKQLEQNFGSF